MVETLPLLALKRSTVSRTFVPSVPPAPWDWQDVPHGTVHLHGYASKSLGRARELAVYTPPGYERSGSHAVVIDKIETKPESQ